MYTCLPKKAEKVFNSDQRLEQNAGILYITLYAKECPKMMLKTWERGVCQQAGFKVHYTIKG